MAFSSDSVQVFLSVLDNGSFSAAARKLQRVPSAVSMAIAQLESELDMRLFDRVGREPRPTAAAAQWVDNSSGAIAKVSRSSNPICSASACRLS